MDLYPIRNLKSRDKGVASKLLSGAFYHVMNRGNTGMNIYRSGRDREKFLEYVGGVVKRYAIKVHAYCLMTTHYHFLIESILQKGKKRNLARDAAIYLCRQITGATSVVLGRRFDICGAGIAARHDLIAKKLEADRKHKGRQDRIRRKILMPGVSGFS